MIIPDINVLLYAYDTESPFHKKAAKWWAECLSGTEPVGLAAVVHTSDTDFLRFPGLRCLNPLTGAGSRPLQNPR